MPLLNFMLVFILVGVALWFVNAHVSKIMAPAVVTVLNYAVVGALILWTLSVLGILGGLETVRVGP
jgi:hypothetical protein